MNELDKLLSELAKELTAARFELGKIPSDSAALRNAIEYLELADDDVFFPDSSEDTIPNLLKPQAM